VQRKITQLEIEKQALKKEKDAASRDRLIKIEEELKELKAESDEMISHWRMEKEIIGKIGEIKERLESTRTAARWQKGMETCLRRLSSVWHHHCPEKELEAQNARLNELQKGKKMLKEEVDAEDIAEVVAKWTNIPVSKLMQGEREKLIKMEEMLSKRV
jgi:ATP-dependent Clp protease ATP-binding subunit ClpB